MAVKNCFGHPVTALGAIALCCFLILGCSQPAPGPKPGAEPAEKEEGSASIPGPSEKTNEEAAILVLEEEPVVVDADGALPLKKDLLSDGSFEVWSANAPVGWKVSLAGSVIESSKVLHGIASAELKPNPDTFTTVEMLCPQDFSGRRIRALAKGLASEADKLVFSVLYRVGDEDKYSARNHSGGGEWETMRVEFIVPEDAKPGSVRLRIGLRPGSESSAFVDDVKLFVIE